MIITTDKVLRPREANDFYPTPPLLAQAALHRYAPSRAPRYVLDPGAGTGVWGDAVTARYQIAPIPPYLVGVDLYAPKKAFGYHDWYGDDYLTWDSPYRYDLIVGNPPYRDAEAFIRKAWTQLAPGGHLIFLLRLAFLEGQARARGLWRTLPPAHVGICAARPSFTGNGKTDATAYAVFHWVQGWQEGPPRLDWLDWTAPAATQQRMMEDGA